MTWDKVREELEIVRENKKTTDRIFKRIKELEEHRFDRLHKVTDPSRDYTTGRHSADDVIIDTIDAGERERARLIKRLEELPTENEEVINELSKVDGMCGELARGYYTQGHSVATLSKWTGYSKTQIYRMIIEATERVWGSLSRADM